MTSASLDPPRPVVEANSLVIRSVRKAFGPTVALDDVSLDFLPGQVHGLVGENGSGKSTLVKVIAGAHTADSGTVTLGGVELRAGVTDSRVACVYQDGTLIDELTIAQNLDLMVSPADRSPFIGARGTDWQRALLDSFGLDEIEHDRLVSDTTPSQARLVEIVGVLAGRPQVVLFDESTSTLDAAGVQLVLGLMKTTAEQGGCVIFVTHRLKEVLAVAEHLSVLRDGRVVADLASEGVSESTLIEAMAGRQVASFTRRDSTVRDEAEAVLVTRGLFTSRGGPVDMRVRPGEIVGIGGAAGNGQSEFVRALAGSGIRAGDVQASGRSVTRTTDAAVADIVFVSSDRRAESLASGLSIRENFTLSEISAGSPAWGWLGRRAEVIQSRALAARFGLVHSSIEQPADSMSGGNQQKLAIGRAIARRPQVLIVEEPTEGVDARSRFDIYRALVEFSESGAAVVIASSDASELRLLADRVIVLTRGRAVAELTGDQITEQTIVEAFTTAIETSPAVPGASTPPAQGSGPVETEKGQRGWLRRSRRGAARPWEISKFGLLALFMVALGAYATSVDPRFLSISNIGAICLFALPVLLVALAQLPVMLSGQIDASLGSMMGLTVVTVSFFPELPLAILAMLSCGLGLVLGLINATLVVGLRINSVIATIATLGIFYGAAAMLRPSPSGLINPDLTVMLLSGILGIPGMFLLAAAAAVALDLAVYRTRRGLSVRAVGYELVRAANLGVRTGRIQAGAFVLAGGVAGLAGLVLAARTGVGDASVGASYTLLAIAVPVLGGALLSGGHGSAVGCVIAALFVAEVQILVPFINLPNGGFLVSVGLLTVLALIVGSRGQMTVGAEVD